MDRRGNGGERAMGATDLISDSAVQPSDREPEARGPIGSTLARVDLAFLPAFLATALMVLWAAHDGGYDQDTWYWGALALVAALAGMVVARDRPWARMTQPLRGALIAFPLDVAWSHLAVTC